MRSSYLKTSKEAPLMLVLPQASQDLEEDRLEHLKSTLLNCANAVATASLFESEVGRLPSYPI